LVIYNWGSHDGLAETGEEAPRKENVGNRVKHRERHTWVTRIKL
jgi:hypothetical protein